MTALKNSGIPATKGREANGILKSLGLICVDEDGRVFVDEQIPIRKPLSSVADFVVTAQLWCFTV